MPLSVGGLQGTTPAFDLQGHRGAWGLSPQNSLYTVARAMAIGVSTLELDLGVTKDGQVVVNHDRHAAPGLFTDTSALFPGDSQYPYVGRRIADLTLAQLKTLNCEIDLRAGSSKRYAGVLPSPPSPAVVPTLFEVFEMCSSPVAASGGAIPAGVRFNLEAKVHPGHPRDTLAPGPFVDRVAEVIDAYGTAPRTMLSSFDWRVLGVASKAVPELSLAALVNESNFREGRTRGWTAGTDVWRWPFSGDVAAAACSIGATVLCVSWANVTDRLIRSAHRLSMRVIAWTVN